MRYSPSARGFYPENIDYPNLPSDVMYLSQDDYLALLAAQAAGKEIVPDDLGNPVAADPPPVTEDALRAVMSLSLAQLLIGLVGEGWITEAEGTAWLAGTLPAAVDGLIATLPAHQRFVARARAVSPSVVLRLDPLVSALAAAQGKTDADLDTFFLTYAKV